MRKTQREVVIAYIGLLLAVAATACTPILIRISEGAMSPFATIFNRVWIVVLILGLWNLGSFLKSQLTSSRPLGAGFGSRPPLLLLGLICTALPCQLFWAWSLTKTSVANSEVLHSFTPVFTTLIGWLFLQQSFDRLFLLGILITVGGSILLVGNDYSTAPEKLIGDALALISALFWALYLILSKRIQSQMEPIEIVGYISFGSAILMSILLYFIGTDGPIFPDSLNDWLIEFVLGALSILSQVLILRSMKVFSPGLVATVLLLNPIVTALLAYLIFSEFLSFLDCLAMFIVITGIYLTSLGKVKQKNRHLSELD
ncbi:MAG: DMT family transporter [Symploca sp. SIO2C1]|nr:DMT family transporter [Symploca sp. SIO2C1]